MKLLLSAGTILVPPAPAGAQPRSSPVCAPACQAKLSNARLLDSAPGQTWTVELAARQDWPQIVLSPPDAGWNWKGGSGIELDIHNLADRPLDLLLRLDDDAHATGDLHSLTGRVQLQPRQRTTLSLPLEAREAGLLGHPSGPDPTHPGETLIGTVHGNIDLTHVVALRISGTRADAPATLRIAAPRLVTGDDRRARLAGIADDYGQSTRGTWPEKVASDDDLRNRLASAQRAVEQLLRDPVPQAGRFHGLPHPSGFRATGFFRAEKRDGRWWLVTPDGNGFFSLGVDGVSPQGRTPVKGREFMFAALPRPGDALAGFLGPQAENPQWLDVRAANLRRGLGPDWAGIWPRQTLQRLQAWGFNTLGNWSHPSVTDAHVLPYAVPLDIPRSGATIQVTDRRGIADPFDPAFAKAADEAARAASEGRRDDPMLLGYFGANELPWRGIGKTLLTRPGDSPARQALIQSLRDRYGDAARFAAAWSLPGLASWDALRAPLTLSDPLSARVSEDLDAFEANFAGRWFQTVAEALKRHDPNHLFLGSRFAAWTPASVRACARWCDVLSFNVYGHSPERDVAKFWHGIDKPVLIGEFHFGSTDRGHFWPGLVDAGSEDRRAAAYAAYVQAAANDPDVVGAHWFEYADEPLTGRMGDGENGHIGLVGVTDIPWEGFTAGVARANRAVLRHLEQPAPDQPSRPPPRPDGHS